MSSNRNPPEEALHSFRRSFSNTLAAVASVFGDHSFHRWMPERDAWRNQVLAALYDAQMFACQDYNRDQLAPYGNDIVAGFKRLFEEEGFRRSIDAATNTPSYFKDRIRRLRKLIDETAHLA